MKLRDRAGLSAARLAALEAAVAGHEILEDVLRWGKTLDPSATIADVIVQDEYTHDVIFPLDPNHILVYGTT